MCSQIRKEEDLQCALSSGRKRISSVLSAQEGGLAPALRHATAVRLNAHTRLAAFVPIN